MQSTFSVTVRPLSVITSLYRDRFIANNVSLLRHAAYATADVFDRLQAQFPHDDEFILALQTPTGSISFLTVQPAPPAPPAAPFTSSLFLAATMASGLPGLAENGEGEFECLAFQPARASKLPAGSFTDGDGSVFSVKRVEGTVTGVIQRNGAIECNFGGDQSTFSMLPSFLTTFNTGSGLIVAQIPNGQAVLTRHGLLLEVDSRGNVLGEFDLNGRSALVAQTLGEKGCAPVTPATFIPEIGLVEKNFANISITNVNSSVLGDLIDYCTRHNLRYTGVNVATKLSPSAPLFTTSNDSFVIANDITLAPTPIDREVAQTYLAGTAPPAPAPAAALAAFAAGAAVGKQNGLPDMRLVLCAERFPASCNGKVIDVQRIRRRMNELYDGHWFTTKEKFIGPVFVVGEQREFQGCYRLSALAQAVHPTCGITPGTTVSRFVAGYTALTLELEPALEKTEPPSTLTEAPKISSFLFDNPQENGLGGFSHILKDLFDHVFMTHLLPKGFIERYGIRHTRGMILYGPPGCGKTLVAKKIAELLNAKIQVINGPELMDKYVGEFEKNIRKLFEPCQKDWEEGRRDVLHVIIFDEFDAICSTRSAGGDAGSNARNNGVNQLLTMLDGINTPDNFIVIGMTNRLDLIDPAVKRPGRFSFHTEVGLPDEAGRKQIFEIHCRKFIEQGALNADVDLAELARRTPNYSGAEIAQICGFARDNSISDFIKAHGMRAITNATNVNISRAHFEKAVKLVPPAAGSSASLGDRLTRITHAHDPSSAFAHLHKEADRIVAFIQKHQPRSQTTVRPDAVHRIRVLFMEGAPASGVSTVACEAVATVAETGMVPCVQYLNSASKMRDIDTAFECCDVVERSVILFEDFAGIDILDLNQRLLSLRASNKLHQCIVIITKPQNGSATILKQQLRSFPQTTITLNDYRYNVIHTIRDVLIAAGIVDPSDPADMPEEEPLALGMDSSLGNVGLSAIQFSHSYMEAKKTFGDVLADSNMALVSSFDLHAVDRLAELYVPRK